MTYVRSVGEESIFNSWALTEVLGPAGRADVRVGFRSHRADPGSTAEPRPGQRLHAQAGGDERDKRGRDERSQPKLVLLGAWSDAADRESSSVSYVY